MVTTSLIQPRSSEKMDAIFNALEDGWPEAKRNRRSSSQYIIWGVIGNNAEIIRSGMPYWFIDAPYHGRWKPGTVDWDPTYWRICKQGLHNNQRLDVTSERFSTGGIDLKEMRSGDHILICPSSQTMTMLTHGCSVEEWVARVKKTLAFYTNRPIKVRHKPRKNGTSGPAIADVSIEEELKDCHAVVTSVSLTAIDALKNGVQVFSTSPHNPAGWCANTGFEEINKLTTFDRESLFANLAWKQYSVEEMRNGFAYENLSRLFNNQGF